MGYQKIASNSCCAISTFCTLVFCCLRGAVVLAWNIATRSQETYEYEDVKLRRTCETTERTDFDNGSHSSFTSVISQKYQRDLVRMQNETYSSKYEQMKTKHACLTMNGEIRKISYQNKLMQKRIMLLEDTLNQEKRNHEDLLTAITDELKFRDKALTVLQNTNVRMQVQIEMLEDSEIRTNSNIQKLVQVIDCLNEKITSSPPTDPQLVKELDNKIDLLQDMLLAGKKSLTQSNEDINKEIVGVRSEIAVLKRNRCDYDMLRNDVNKLRVDLNDFESRSKKYLIESVRAKDVDSETTSRLTRKYDRLKFRLGLVENDLKNVSSSHTRNMVMCFARGKNDFPTEIFSPPIPLVLPAPPGPPAPPEPPAPPAPPASPEQSVTPVPLVIPAPTEISTPPEPSAPTATTCTKDSCASGDSSDTSDSEYVEFSVFSN